MNLSPRGIREHLGLNKPIYARTSAYGHFGRAPDADGGFSWEKTDLADQLRGLRLLTGRAPIARRPTRRDPPRRALYGRSRGKTLRAHHARLVAELLPQLEIDRGRARRRRDRCFRSRRARSGWRSASAAASTRSRRRARNPDIGFIGCEPFINGVAKLLAGDRRASGSTTCALRAGDARALIEAAAGGVPVAHVHPLSRSLAEAPPATSAGSISRGDDRANWRASRGPARELRFATDIDDYAGWTLRRFLASPDFAGRARRADDWRMPWAGWAATRYEAKARAAGRPSAYLTFVRR